LEFLPGYKEALQGLANQAGVTLSEQDLLDFAMGKVPGSMKAATTATQTFITKGGELAPITEAMSKSLEDVGLSAYGAVTDIEKFTQSLFNAGLLSLSASDAAIAYEAAIDAVTESVTKNGTTLDLNTEKGRANQSAYNDLAKSAMTVATATAEETLKTQGSAAAQQTLQAGLSQSYKDLITAAGQFGITGDAAAEMARKALGIPKNVNIDAWIADHASTTLDAIKGKAESLDGKIATVRIQTIQETYNRVINGGPDPNRPGQAAPMAVGGAVIGRGQKGVDSELRLLAPGEHVLSDSDVDAMGGQAGVYEFRKHLHSGGSATGYQYAPAAAPAVTHRAPAVASASASAPADVRVYIGNEQIDARIVHVASGVVGAADSGSQFMRKGRG
jgi:hypothetical protein